jgi:23S rRNA pseudouridine2605 synthase
MTSRTRKGREQVSLIRAISKFGLASRTQAEHLVRQGCVRVNGRPVRSPFLWLDPRVDRISIGDQPVRAAHHVYLALFKPAGYVTTRSDERGRRTVYDLLPADVPHLFPVGRLDKETSGLLLFTNDVRFGERVTSPLRHVMKTYLLSLSTPLAAHHADLWRRGMVLADGTALRPVVVSLSVSVPQEVTMTLIEGKNRQVRRMAEELGYTVVRLVRMAIGDVTLEGLVPGGVRMLTEQEYTGLTAQADPAARMPVRSKPAQWRERRTRRDDRKFPGPS